MEADEDGGWRLFKSESDFDAIPGGIVYWMMWEKVEEAML